MESLATNRVRPGTLGAGAGSGAAGTTVIGRVRLALSSAIAAILGLLPHVLHHAGPLAGAALFAGVGGSLLFGALGFVAAIPMLVRLHRRFGTWRAPATALALFATVFAVSTFLVGPAIAGDDSDDSPSTQQSPTPAGHESHH